MDRRTKPQPDLPESASPEPDPIDPRAVHYWAAVHLVAAVTGAGVEDITGTTRGDRRAAYARQLVATLIHVEAQGGNAQSLSEIARRLGRDRSSVSHAIHAVEDDREDRDVDAGVDKLAALVKRLVDLHVELTTYAGWARRALEE